jgi:hypothetical protein
VVESAEDGAGTDRTAAEAVRRLGRGEGERAVRPGGVVVGDELAEDGPEVPLVEHDQVIDALAA